ncbi:hypothetical protein D5086_021385 [Populus alba]|uniref:Uncharacterized protein n=1 Tax=Populus alba TaxID=43335 RepID=A0ACC4BC17_POPAL
MAKGKAHAPPVVPVSPQSDAHSPVLTPTALDKGKAHIELQHIVKRHFAPPDQSDALLPSTSATIALLPPVEAAQPLLIQHTKPIPTLPMPITEPVDQQLLDDSDSSQDSGIGNGSLTSLWFDGNAEQYDEHFAVQWNGEWEEINYIVTVLPLFTSICMV